MPAIPEKLLRCLCKTLLDRWPFDKILAKFVDDNPVLKPQSLVCDREARDSETKRLQVLAIISSLQDEYLTGTQKNALLMFLQELPHSAELAELIKKLTSVLAPKPEDVRAGVSSPFLTESGAGVRSEETSLYREKLSNIERAVGELYVPQFKDGESTGKLVTGTAWLITSTLALTCYHVIENRKADGMSSRSGIQPSDLTRQVSQSRFTLGYNEPARGIPYGVSRLENFNSELDYALLRLENNRTDWPLADWGIVPLALQAPLTQGMPLQVIQHPRGDPRRTVNGECREVNEAGIFHSALTDEGASGGPVLDAVNLTAIALHTGKGRGERPQATRISAILRRIQKDKPDLYEEIKKSQPEGGL
jgi:V8-like Glu-specific endopeptidase